jgi:hypothetical protein
MDLVLLAFSNAGHHGEPPTPKLLISQQRSLWSFDNHSFDRSHQYLTSNTMEDIYSVYVVSFPYITSPLNLAYQVACSIAPATAAESLYEFQLVKFLFQIGCGVDNSSADMKNHPLAILLARGRGDRIGNIVNLFCGEHGSCGVVAQGLALPESVKLLSFRHAEGT